MRVRSAAALLVLVACASCDRRLEPWVEREAEPPRNERPILIPGLNAPIARSEPRATSAPAAPAAVVGASIRGTVRLADGQTSQAAETLFVIARSSETGPPLAVKRLSPGPFPLEFEIGPADVMLPGMSFAGPIRLSARLDRDGDPLSRDPAEPSATLAHTVEPGASGIEIVLRAGSG